MKPEKYLEIKSNTPSAKGIKLEEETSITRYCDQGQPDEEDESLKLDLSIEPEDTREGEKHLLYPSRPQPSIFFYNVNIQLQSLYSSKPLTIGSKSRATKSLTGGCLGHAQYSTNAMHCSVRNLFPRHAFQQNTRRRTETREAKG